ncbi:DNA invertase Pin-like site-specific DNA recombinase [Spinactinospora alkalitolerans]|uniref:DNA invertase Pin-like site-specific DNA recombinase n=1 Tax=Spinactinospora alkalitolerans TaxID=687207 RepID=A0A852TZ15_9ACTN|nr:helix-turn-helix domain-containing protein [Spinactinospora alkalitolerans]NYE48252.1 DNA invertase Pin-like site-specific DNA recombinase [Spinactinospora alkalitolerans]
MEDDRISTLAESARGGSPLAALIATAQLRREVERLEAVHVRRARLQGATWAEIATILGVSKQAVHKKYGGRRKER